MDKILTGQVVLNAACTVYLGHCHEQISNLTLFFRTVVIILNNFHFDLSTVPQQMEKVKLNGTYNT